jgi:hypothetical protein
MPIGGKPKKEKSGDDDDEDDEEACVRYDENGNLIKKDDEDESFVSLWGGVSLDASREFEFRSAGARFFCYAICSCMWCESANDITYFICRTYSYTLSLSLSLSLSHTHTHTQGWKSSADNSKTCTRLPRRCVMLFPFC